MLILPTHQLPSVMRSVVWSILGLGSSRFHIGPWSKEVATSFAELDWAVCGLAVAVAFLVKMKNSRFYLPNRLPHFFRRSRLTQIAVIFILSVAARLSFLGVEPAPVPFVHDEFSFLLSADTFAHGRLTNPTPPAWPHFETFHVLMHPTYISKYPPAQGLFLGLGQALMGTPFAGVVLECALMCAALCWLLQSVMPPRWAFLGGLMAVVRLSLASYWDDGFCGGAVAAMAGCLLLGGVLRLAKHWKYRYGIVVGVALFLLANSRPFEGFVFSIVPMIYLIAKAWQSRSSVRLTPAIVATVATVCAGCIWTGYYNFKVTGSATILPEAFHQMQYSNTPALVFLPIKPLAHPENVSLQKNDYSFEAGDWKRAHSGIGAYLSIQIERLMAIWSFFLGPALSMALLGAGRAIKDKRLRIFLYAGALMVVTLLIETWFHEHYAAAGLGVIYVFLLSSIRYLGTWRRARRTGAVLVNGLLLAVALGAVLRLAVTPGWFPTSWAGIRLPGAGRPVALFRQAIEQSLFKMGGKHVVLVHYLPGHGADAELVYNGYDIPSQKVVWAHDGGTDIANTDLFCAFRDHRFWYMELDESRQILDGKLTAELHPVSTEGKCGER